MIHATIHDQKKLRITKGQGFIAALDQSGGSTPKTLQGYGYTLKHWKNENEMFALVHQMRSRVIQSPAFSSGKIIGAILFEKTLRGDIDGLGTAEYLWQRCGIVSFLKVDAGLEEETDGVQLMKPIPRMAELLELARNHGVYGTKMRSVIKSENRSGIVQVVAQQFRIAREIIDAGLVPIVEPEVDIHAPNREAIEAILLEAMIQELDALAEDQNVILKLSIPAVAGTYSTLCDHSRVQRLVALSGGFSTQEACERLAQNSGMIASFSRALLEKVSVGQSDDEFDAVLDETVSKIVVASS